MWNPKQQMQHWRNPLKRGAKRSRLPRPENNSRIWCFWHSRNGSNGRPTKFFGMSVKILQELYGFRRNSCPLRKSRLVPSVALLEFLNLKFYPPFYTLQGLAIPLNRFRLVCWPFILVHLLVSFIIMFKNIILNNLTKFFFSLPSLFVRKKYLRKKKK